jgi:hypothetical protein
MLLFPVEPRSLSIPYPTHIAPTYLLISRSQYRVFQIPHFVAPLSIIGSLAIVYRILRFDRYDLDARNRRTYHRLLVAMSICDVFGSGALIFATTPIPRETLLELARGNTATCTAQGFFFHWFALAVLYYNTGLMIYFALTIRYRWTESRAAKWLEPVIHVWSLLVPFAQAVAGLFLNIFNPIGFGNFCQISPYPLLCGLFDACTRGQSATYLYTYFVTIPVCVLLATIYVSIILIYCAVRGQAHRASSITMNRESVRARTKSVAVQSWLFAGAFFVTWILQGISPILSHTIKNKEALVKMNYICSVLTSTFLPLQGFFNFCIYIRPRLMRLWVGQNRPFCVALKLAVFGGRESSISQRQLRRKSSNQTLAAARLPNAPQENETGGSSTVAADFSEPIRMPNSFGLAETGNGRNIALTTAVTNLPVAQPETGAPSPETGMGENRAVASKGAEGTEGGNGEITPVIEGESATEASGQSTVTRISVSAKLVTLAITETVP